MKKCEVCGATEKETKITRNLCNKHYLQIWRYGKIKKYTRNMPNKIIKFKDYALLECTDSNYNNKYTKIDLDDVERVSKYKWTIDKSTNYVRTSSNGKNFKLHRFILRYDDNLFIDHINNNRLDNRKNNLRIVTPKQNALNSSLCKNNTSSYKGIHKQKSKWVVRIRYNNSTLYLGWYKSFKEALIVRISEEIKLYKEFANYNLIFQTMKDNEISIKDLNI
jgi:hypothetical protein